MYSRTQSSPSATIFFGVSAALKSGRVALLTPASVACADSTTATSSVNGLRCSSSPLGSGSAAWNRRKISSMVSLDTFGLRPFGFGRRTAFAAGSSRFAGLGIRALKYGFRSGTCDDREDTASARAKSIALRAEAAPFARPQGLRHPDVDPRLYQLHRRLCVP